MRRWRRPRSTRTSRGKGCDAPTSKPIHGPDLGPGYGRLRIMRVSAKSDYALRALIEITQRWVSNDPSVVSAEELSRAQGIPHGFLQGILADLRRAGVLSSQRGQSGGWKLAVDPNEVSVADVMRAVDGPIVSISGVRPESVAYNERAVVLQRVWIAARSTNYRGRGPANYRGRGLARRLRRGSGARPRRGACPSPGP